MKVSWTVMGARNDLWVQRHGVKVEVEKDPSRQGTYLVPDLFGYGADRSLIPAPRGTTPDSSRSGTVSRPSGIR